MFLKTEKDQDKIEQYAMLFLRNGYAVKFYPRYSLLVENQGNIGAFTVRDDGRVAGAFFKSVHKEDLLNEYNLAVRLDSHPSALGWFFYHKIFDLMDGSGNHDFSFGEVEWMVKNHQCA